MSIPAFPDRTDLRGIGLSDDWRYAEKLPSKLSYRNTFYHREPRLDLTDPPEELVGTLDFLIASDVLEHVAPPVERAFENAFRLLKPAGVFILTVPDAPDTSTLQPESTSRSSTSMRSSISTDARSWSTEPPAATGRYLTISTSTAGTVPRWRCGSSLVPRCCGSFEQPGSMTSRNGRPPARNGASRGETFTDFPSWPVARLDSKARTGRPETASYGTKMPCVANSSLSPAVATWPSAPAS